MSDLALERRIGRAYQKLIIAASQDRQRRWWKALKALVGRRSPEQIHRMERERALR